MSIDLQYMNYTTNPEDSVGGKFDLPKNFDYGRYYDLKVNYVGNMISATSGKPYYKIIWEFVDQKQYGKWRIYDNYSIEVKWKNAQFENIYKNWGCQHKCTPVEGKVVQAKLKKKTYGDNKEKERFEIEDIKQWHMLKERPTNPKSLNDDIPF